MDILSHGLWAGVLSKVAHRRYKCSLSFKQSFFWGVFPDLFAFVLPTMIVVGLILTGNASWNDFQTPHNPEPPILVKNGIVPLTGLLYNISHSLVIFIGVFILVRLIFKRWVFELGGWLLHIVADIPTHSYTFYPTPFLWPFSDWKFDGLPWSTPWFMLLNYSMLVALYGILYITAPDAKETTAKQ